MNYLKQFNHLLINAHIPYVFNCTEVMCGNYQRNARNFSHRTPRSRGSHGVCIPQMTFPLYAGIRDFGQLYGTQKSPYGCALALAKGNLGLSQDINRNKHVSFNHFCLLKHFQEL